MRATAAIREMEHSVNILFVRDNTLLKLKNCFGKANKENC